MKNKKNLTEGPITKTLMSLALPIMFSNILQSAYGLIDTFWVGRLGTKAVASIALSFPILFFMMALGIGLAIASSVLVAQFKGRGNQEKMDHVVGQSVLMAVILAFVVGTVGFFLAGPLMRMAGNDPEVIGNAISYLKISFLGAPFLFGYIIFQSLMRGVGEVKIPILIGSGSLLLNLILDPFFIMGWGPIPAFGVAGAAFATIGTQSLSVMFALVLLLRGSHSLQLHLRNLLPEPALLKTLFKIGIPSSIEMSARALGQSALTFIIAGFGAVAIAAYGVGTQIFTMVIIPAMGFMMATSAIVGQNLGAGKNDRAQATGKRSAQVSACGLAVAAVLIYIFGENLANILVPGEAETTMMAAEFLRYMSFGFAFLGIQQSLAGAVNGAGKTKWSMMVTVFFLWVLQIPLAYILSHYTGLAEKGFWLSFPIANIGGALTMMVIFSRMKWDEVKVAH